MKKGLENSKLEQIDIEADNGFTDTRMLFDNLNIMHGCSKLFKAKK